MVWYLIRNVYILINGLQNSLRNLYLDNVFSLSLALYPNLAHTSQEECFCANGLEWPWTTYLCQCKCYSRTLCNSAFDINFSPGPCPILLRVKQKIACRSGICSGLELQVNVNWKLLRQRFKSKFSSMLLILQFFNQIGSLEIEMVIM